MSAESETQPLLQPYRMGEYQLANRVVMAPLTRSRATNPDLAPTDLHVDYYAQRASAGLIITEGTWISQDAVGWHDVPARFAALAPIERSDRSLHYSPGPHGYTDYPPYTP